MSSPGSSPQLRDVSLPGTDLRYLEQGEGAAVVFVHGGASDHRAWDHQRPAVAGRFRFLAIDQRYFGKAPWADDGARFSLESHTADLAGFIATTGAAPVCLVGQSYGAVVALSTALQHPELVRALLINEPPLESILTDRADLELARAETRELASIAATAKAGDAAAATRSFHDWVNGQAGAFDSLSAGLQAMRYDNARTLPFQLSPPARASITCAGVGKIAAPVLITTGAATRTYFRLISTALHRCIPGSSLVTIPGAQHLAPFQAPEPFNRTLLSFLAAS